MGTEAVRFIDEEAAPWSAVMFFSGRHRKEKKRKIKLPIEGGAQRTHERKDPRPEKRSWGPYASATRET